MALSTSIWSAVFNLVDKLDLNTSEIEKIETKFRIARKVNIWVILPTFLIFSLLSSYYIASWLGDYSKFFLIILIASIAATAFVTKKGGMHLNKKGKTLYISTFFVYIATVSVLTMLIGYILSLTAFSYQDFFHWDSIVTILTLIGYVFSCYFMYKVVNYYLTTFQELFSVDAIKKPILYITTSNNSSYSCILLNITKRGDYIIKPLKSQNDFIHNKNLEINLDNAFKATYEEILLNRLHIVDTKYLGELESLKDKYGENIANKLLATIEEQNKA